MMMRTQRRLQQFRSSQLRRTKLPESLWQAAKIKNSCGRRKSGNPNPGFPLSHRPDSLRRKERTAVYTKDLARPLCQRPLKQAVLHRKNALFYRTLHGAEVGDLFMTLIHTCQLCGANSFDYLVELQRHARELAANPAEWMPWSYRETLARPAV